MNADHHYHDGGDAMAESAGPAERLPLADASATDARAAELVARILADPLLDQVPADEEPGALRSWHVEGGRIVLDPSEDQTGSPEEMLWDELLHDLDPDRLDGNDEALAVPPQGGVAGVWAEAVAMLSEVKAQVGQVLGDGRESLRRDAATMLQQVQGESTRILLHASALAEELLSRAADQAKKDADNLLRQTHQESISMLNDTRQLVQQLLSDAQDGNSSRVPNQLETYRRGESPGRWLFVSTTLKSSPDLPMSQLATLIRSGLEQCSCASGGLSGVFPRLSSWDGSWLTGSQWGEARPDEQDVLLPSWAAGPRQAVLKHDLDVTEGGNIEGGRADHLADRGGGRAARRAGHPGP